MDALGLFSACGLVLMAAHTPRSLSHEDRLTLGIIGAIALFQSVPSTVGYFTGRAAALTGMITWAVGGALVLVSTRRNLAMVIVYEIVGGVAFVGGPAITWFQWRGFAPAFGIAVAVALVSLGMMPGKMMFSALGLLGLLINVPWTIVHFFPGQARAPLLILVSGALIIGIAALLSIRAIRGGWSRNSGNGSSLGRSSRLVGFKHSDGPQLH